MDAACRPLVRDASLSPRKYFITDPFQNDDNHPIRDIEKLYQTIDSVLAHILASDDPGLLSVYSTALYDACVHRSKIPVYSRLLQAWPVEKTLIADTDIQNYFRTKPPNVRIKDLMDFEKFTMYYEQNAVRWGIVPFEKWDLTDVRHREKPESNELWLSKALVDAFLEAPADSDLEVQCKMIIVDTLFREYAHCLLKTAFSAGWLMQICGHPRYIYDNISEVRLDVENRIFGFSLLVDLPFNDAHPLAVRNMARLIARVNETGGYELDVNEQRTILDSLRLTKTYKAKLVKPCRSVAPGCTHVLGLAYIPWTREDGNQADLPFREDPRAGHPDWLSFRLG